MCHCVYQADGDKNVDIANVSMCQHVYDGDEDMDVDTANVSMCQCVNMSMRVMRTGM